jgi:hypothetical protein
MNTNIRIALNWLEVISFAALVIVGLGIWALIGRLVAAALEDDEPWEEPSRRRHQVVSRQLELAKAQDELTAIRAKSIEHRWELARESALRDALLGAYPQLARISPSSAFTVRPEVLLSYAQARMEVETANLLVSDLEATVAKEIEAIGDQTTFLEAEKPASPGFIKAEARLSLSREQLAAAQKRVVEGRLGQVEKRAKADALAAAHPELPRLIKEAAGPPNVPLEALQVFMDATTRRGSLEALTRALDCDLTRQQRRVAGVLAAVADAQRAASQDLAKEKERFAWVKRGKIFIRSLLLSGLVFLVLLGIVSLPRVRARWRFHRVLVFGGSGGVLLALYFFQMIQVE